MKIIQKCGLLLFVAGLLVLLSSLGMSKYKLTEDSLKKSIPDEKQLTSLHPAFESMLDKEYDSKFEFTNDFRKAFNSVNEDFKKNQQWDKVIYTDYTFPVTKNSSFGLLTDNLILWLLLSFGLAILGALMYIIPQYSNKPAGIKNDGIFHNSMTNRGWIGMILGVFLIAFYVMLYWYPEYITNFVILVDPISNFTNGGPASQWYLYGFLYTICVLIMGTRMILKYRGNKYQIIRSSSVMFFQTCLAFIIPEILVSLNKPWFDFKNMWPLDYTFFYDWNINRLISQGTLGWFMLVWGIILFIVGVPFFTYFFGKRWYCSWICGCGGLAETLGDPYRQLSSKSIRSWKIERISINSVLVFAVIMTVITLINYFSNNRLLGETTQTVHKVYGFAIGAVFSGIVGTGFYPIAGSRVWCRFGCPLAAYLGLMQRFKSRFRITTNGGQCISCGNCSTYCEMGIDVRAYAQKGQNIARASCVGCGICATVCPRGVLKLENADEKGRISSNDAIQIGNNSIKLNL
jgi:ferredoxin-type protein NapH